MKSVLLYLTIFCCSISFFSCKNTSPSVSFSDPELKRISFQSTLDQQERDFFLYLPKGYHSNPDTTYPILCFLHGNGERGDGKEELDYVIKHGPLYEAWIQKRNLPFIIISPQLPMFGVDTLGLDYIDNRDTSSIPKRLAVGTPNRPAKFATPNPMLGAMQVDTFPKARHPIPAGWDQIHKDLIHILDTVQKEYRADTKKTYLTGLSYGGFGTWWMASHYPDRFAAICPVVGWGHPSLMPPIAQHQIPVWAFCGGRDEAVPCRYFYKGINELEKLGHTNVRFTTHEDMGHDTWKRVYGGEDMYDWLLGFEVE